MPADNQVSISARLKDEISQPLRKLTKEIDVYEKQLKKTGQTGSNFGRETIANFHRLFGEATKLGDSIKDLEKIGPRKGIVSKQEIEEFKQLNEQVGRVKGALGYWIKLSQTLDTIRTTSKTIGDTSVAVGIEEYAGAIQKVQTRIEKADDRLDQLKQDLKVLPSSGIKSLNPEFVKLRNNFNSLIQQSPEFKKAFADAIERGGIEELKELDRQLRNNQSRITRVINTTNRLQEAMVNMGRAAANSQRAINQSFQRLRQLPSATGARASGPFAELHQDAKKLEPAIRELQKAFDAAAKSGDKQKFVEIGRQLAQMRKQYRSAVDSVENITDKINTMGDITKRVAERVRQSASAFREMPRAMGEGVYTKQHKEAKKLVNTLQELQKQLKLAGQSGDETAFVRIDQDIARTDARLKNLVTSMQRTQKVADGMRKGFERGSRTLQEFNQRIKQLVKPTDTEGGSEYAKQARQLQQNIDRLSELNRLRRSAIGTGDINEYKRLSREFRTLGQETEKLIAKQKAGSKAIKQQRQAYSQNIALIQQLRNELRALPTGTGFEGRPFLKLKTNATQAIERMNRLNVAMRQFADAGELKKAERAAQIIKRLGDRATKTTQQIKKLTTSKGKFVGKLDELNSVFISVAAGAAAFYYVLVRGVRVVLDSAVKMERLVAGLNAISKSSVIAQHRFQALVKAARQPGVSFEQMIKGSNALQAVGVSARFAEAMIVELGNSLSRVGLPAAELDGVVRGLRQMSSAGVIFQEELNQITSRVPDLNRVLIRAFGTARAVSLQKMNITVSEFLTVVLKGLQGLQRVGDTTANSLQNLNDSFFRTKAAVGEAFRPTLKIVIKALDDIFVRVQKTHPLIIQLVGGITALAGAFGGLLAVTSGFLHVMPGLERGWKKLGSAITFIATNPIALAITGLTILAGIIGVLIIKQRAAGDALQRYKDAVGAVNKDAAHQIQIQRRLAEEKQKEIDQLKALMEARRKLPKLEGSEDPRNAIKYTRDFVDAKKLEFEAISKTIEKKRGERAVDEANLKIQQRTLTGLQQVVKDYRSEINKIGSSEIPNVLKDSIKLTSESITEVKNNIKDLQERLSDDANYDTSGLQKTYDAIQKIVAANEDVIAAMYERLDASTAMTQKEIEQTNARIELYARESRAHLDIANSIGIVNKAAEGLVVKEADAVREEIKKLDEKIKFAESIAKTYRERGQIDIAERAEQRAQKFTEKRAERDIHLSIKTGRMEKILTEMEGTEEETRKTKLREDFLKNWLDELAHQQEFDSSSQVVKSTLKSFEKALAKHDQRKLLEKLFNKEFDVLRKGFNELAQQRSSVEIRQGAEKDIGNLFGRVHGLGLDEHEVRQLSPDEQLETQRERLRFVETLLTRFRSLIRETEIGHTAEQRKLREVVPLYEEALNQVSERVKLEREAEKALAEQIKLSNVVKREEEKRISNAKELVSQIGQIGGAALEGKSIREVEGFFKRIRIWANSGGKYADAFQLIATSQEEWAIAGRNAISEWNDRVRTHLESIRELEERTKHQKELQEEGQKISEKYATRQSKISNLTVKQIDNEIQKTKERIDTIRKLGEETTAVGNYEIQRARIHIQMLEARRGFADAEKNRLEFLDEREKAILKVREKLQDIDLQLQVRDLSSEQVKGMLDSLTIFRKEMEIKQPKIAKLLAAEIDLYVKKLELAHDEKEANEDIIETLKERRKIEERLEKERRQALINFSKNIAQIAVSVPFDFVGSLKDRLSESQELQDELKSLAEAHAKEIKEIDMDGFRSFAEKEQEKVNIEAAYAQQRLDIEKRLADAKKGIWRDTLLDFASNIARFVQQRIEMKIAETITDKLFSQLNKITGGGGGTQSGFWGKALDFLLTAGPTAAKLAGTVSTGSIGISEVAGTGPGFIQGQHVSKWLAKVGSEAFHDPRNDKMMYNLGKFQGSRQVYNDASKNLGTQQARDMVDSFKSGYETSASRQQMQSDTPIENRIQVQIDLGGMDMDTLTKGIHRNEEYLIRRGILSQRRVAPA